MKVSRSVLLDLKVIQIYSEVHLYIQIYNCIFRNFVYTIRFIISQYILIFIYLDLLYFQILCKYCLVCKPLTALEMYKSNTGYTLPTQVISLISFTANPSVLSLHSNEFLHTFKAQASPQASQICSPEAKATGSTMCLVKTSLSLQNH